MKTYNAAEMEVVNFVTEDVIATSGLGNGGLINGGADDSDILWGEIHG